MSIKPQKPSKIIENLKNSYDYDWSDSCGETSCECYDNKQMIKAILEYLDERFEKQHSSTND